MGQRAYAANDWKAMPLLTSSKPDLTLDRVGPVVGLQEIAVLLDVDARTPHAWAYRDILPVPDFDSINGSRAWHRETIVRWAAETGRLPEFLADEIAGLDIEVPEQRGGRKAAEKARQELAKAVG